MILAGMLLCTDYILVRMATLFFGTPARGLALWASVPYANGRSWLLPMSKWGVAGALIKTPSSRKQLPMQRRKKKRRKRTKHLSLSNSAANASWKQAMTTTKMRKMKTPKTRTKTTPLMKRTIPTRLQTSQKTNPPRSRFQSKAQSSRILESKTMVKKTHATMSCSSSTPPAARRRRRVRTAADRFANVQRDRVMAKSTRKKSVSKPSKSKRRSRILASM